MANPGVGNKFLSVNLNKSYGQSSQPNPTYSGYGSRKARVGGHGGGGSGSGGMVVLSRPRSSSKAGSKLSVPPPLNLPSLRKEHEKLDPLGSSGGLVAGGALRNAARPNSSGTGWSKPSGVGAGHPLSSGDANSGLQTMEGTSKHGDNSSYMPTSARLGVIGSDVHVLVPAEKNSVLASEDFPSLRATMAAAANGTPQRQKDALSQKQRQVDNGDLSGLQEGSQLSSRTDSHPKVQFTEHSVGKGHEGSGDSSGLDNSRKLGPGQKREDYLSDPLPLVTLSPRSDWADDERDTGNAFLDRDRDNGYSHNEIYWDKNFGLPRSSIFPYKTSQNVSNRWLHQINDAGKPLVDEISISDFIRDAGKRQEGNLWRSSTTRVGMTVSEVPMEKSIDCAKTTVNQEMRKDNKYIPPHCLGDGSSSGASAGKGLPFGGKDLVNGHGGRQQWCSSGGSLTGRGAERSMRDRYGSESCRHKTDLVQNNLVPKSSFSSISKGLPLNDPLLNSGKEKRSFPRGEKPYAEDPFLEDWGGSGFDGRDPLSGVLIGVVKRKKDINKEVDFHDHVRESFEAELERVQKLQEQERQRIIEEQERALEMALREEEERKRLAKEQEERQRKLEEETREAAWRAEQERLEAIQRAEEQRIVREEEKRKMLAEEERRKQAAKQKLHELEKRIARREAEQAKANSSAGAAYEEVPEVFKEKDSPRVEDQGWEDTERMVERITNSSSSDSSSLNKSFDVSRVHSVRDGSHAFMERGKPSSPWGRDTFENGNGSSVFSMNQDSGHYGPRRGASFNGREFVQKDFTAGAGYIASRSQYRVGMPETNFGDFFHGKGSSWSVSGDDSFDIGENIGDGVWGHGCPHGDFNSAFSDGVHQNVEQDEFYMHGRSRYSLRQPRVLPPPSFSSLHRTPFRNENQHAGSPAHEDIHNQKSLVLGVSSGPAYSNIHSEIQGHSDVVDHDNATKMELNLQCDSQSSLSVSSPPTSPTHLSHDDFNESGDKGVVSEPEETIKVSVSGNETLLLNSKDENAVSASCSISLGDDEWNLENNDEDENGYHDEDEVHAEDENASLNKDFEGIRLEEKDSNHLMENLVLGFDQGVEVGMPSDESETNPRMKEFSCVLPEVSRSIVREQKSFEGRELDELRLQFSEITLHANADNSGSAQQPEKETNDMVVQSMSVVSASQSVSPSEMRSHLSGQMVTSTAATRQTQSELPVKLQFGLFSGPSLIPSPVPSIQIGSIQMPLELHPQVGPPFVHMHPAQPPKFQFGQIAYPSPVSHGISPLISHSMTFVQSNIPSNCLIQKMGGHFASESHQESHAEGVGKGHTLSHSFNNNHAYQKQTSSTNTIAKEVNINHGGQSGESDMLSYSGPTEGLKTGGNEAGIEAKNSIIKVRKELTSLATPASLPSSDVSESHSQSAPYRESIYGVRDGWTAHGQFSGSNRRKFALISRNRGQKSFHPPESLHNDSNGFKRKVRRGSQRMEFRVRQSSDKRQASSVVLIKNSLPDDGSQSYNGNGQGLLPRVALEKEEVSERLDRMHEPETSTLGQFHIHETDSKFKASESLGKESPKKGPDVSDGGDASLKRNIAAEDDVDAPLLSGVVCIFRQPGIESPSDDDDFIEVRSKRQMLNDRREQREKEIKAKTAIIKKATRRLRPIPQGRIVGRNTKKAMSSSSIDVPNVAISGHTMNRGILSNDVSGELKNIGLQPLAPIGTRSPSCHSQDDTRTHNIKSAQAITFPASGQVECGSLLEAKNKIQDSPQASEGTWVQAQLNQQVIPLTHTQLDGAMKPARFELPRVNDNSNIELSIPSSALGKDAAFSTAANPIYSLLAGERIQFGAVTSPTILPPCNCPASHGIGPPCPRRSDHEVTCKILDSKDEHAPFYEKNKQHTDSSLRLEECEIAAEAAASAVAAAAISSDEVAVTRLGTCSVSISDTKSFSHANITETSGNQVAASQSKAEETLNVSLPADLSVETLPISLWPSLPSPQASSQMLSPFSGGSPSQFPFYDINPMIGGHIFAFGPHGESPRSQQQNSESGSGPSGAWQHHSGIDSLYGSPAGFAGHFINPSGSIPGVQGPPRMVVYNHFAPVGQFGPVGLSYMSSTYIPPGKQPDWNHKPVPAAMVSGDGDPTNLNIISTQQNPPSMPHPPVQQLAPLSPLLSMHQPLAMFDVSQFQSSSDIPLQGHWTHIPPSHHSISRSIQPLQQQAEALLPFQVSQGSSNSQPSAANIANMLPKTQAVPAETSYAFPEQTDSEPAQFSVQHGLVDATGSAEAATSVCVASGSRAEDAGNGNSSVPISSRRRIVQDSVATNKNQAQRQKHSSAQQLYHHPPNYNCQRERGSGTSSMNRSGFDWTDRRVGFQGRNNSSGGDRGFPHTKVKQIYVVKQTTGTTSAV